MYIGDSMETTYDVRQLLKRFGIFVYIGERTADLNLMELEITELYNTKCITVSEYKQAILILKKANRELRGEGKKKMKNRIIGVDIGGTTVKIGILKVTGDLECKWEIPTDKSEEGQLIVEQICHSIEDRLDELFIQKQHIMGIGIG